MIGAFQTFAKKNSAVQQQEMRTSKLAKCESLSCSNGKINESCNNIRQPENTAKKVNKKYFTSVLV